MTLNGLDVSWFDTWMPNLDAVTTKERLSQVKAKREADGATDENAAKPGESSTGTDHRGVVSKEAREGDEEAEGAFTLKAGAIAEFDGTEWTVISEKAMPAFIKKKIDAAKGKKGEEEKDDDEEEE